MQSDTAELPLSDRFWAWYDVNKNMAIGVVVAIVVLGGAIATFVYVRGQSEIKASEELSSISLAQATGASKSESPEAYLKVADSHSGSSAAERAVLLAAGSFFTEGKYDQARVQFERLRREHPASPFVAEALLGIAATYDAQKKTNEAMAAYKDIIDHHSGETVAPQAKFALANLYEGQNKFEQARPLFEDVARSGGSSVGSEAGMRLEELKIRHPELFISPATTQPGVPKGPPLALPRK